MAEQKLAIFSLFSGRDVFVGCQYDSGRISVSKCFRFCSIGGSLGISF